MFRDYERKIYSQNGEDGVLDEIFERIGVHNRLLVEMCCGDASECIGRYWLQMRGWDGLLVDGWAPSTVAGLTVHNYVVSDTNVNEILDSHGIPAEFDLMAIDIDSIDYYLWDALDRRPRVVVIEYNPQVPADEARVIWYDPDMRWQQDDYYGASLKAMAILGERKGYTLVYCDSHGVNAFFVRNDLVPRLFVPERIYRPANMGGIGLRHRPSERTMPLLEDALAAKAAGVPPAS